MKMFCGESFALGMLTGAGVLAAVAAAWAALRMSGRLSAGEEPSGSDAGSSDGCSDFCPEDCFCTPPDEEDGEEAEKPGAVRLRAF